MKIKEPENPSDPWITFPFIGNDIYMTPYFEYEVKVGSVFKFKGTINGNIIKVSNFFN